MYRYKSLEGEYFCNKDFAKKRPLCLQLVRRGGFPSTPFCFTCKSPTPPLFEVGKGLAEALLRALVGDLWTVKVLPSRGR